VISEGKEKNLMLLDDERKKKIILVGYNMKKIKTMLVNATGYWI